MCRLRKCDYRTDARTDGQTDAGQSDPYVPLWHLSFSEINPDLFQQDEAKKKGQPWTLAKGFDTSCPVSDFITKESISNPTETRLWLTVNGATKQDGNTKDMIFSIPYLISYISNYFTLEEGDVVLTGTPSGVGPVNEGDVIEAGLGNVVTMKFNVQKS